MKARRPPPQTAGPIRAFVVSCACCGARQTVSDGDGMRAFADEHQADDRCGIGAVIEIVAPGGDSTAGEIGASELL